MRIIVLADEVIKQEFQKKYLNGKVQFIFTENLSESEDNDHTDAFFLLKEITIMEDFNFFAEKPVFINSTTRTLKELGLPKNFSRLNGWPTFINREVWEIATGTEAEVVEIFSKLEWKYIVVKDEPGLISARIIAMIINEAYFALDENVSSKEEIDIAMKLGTNYPYGPFEWSKKIGLEKVYSLLKKLNETDNRYDISMAMKADLTTNN